MPFRSGFRRDAKLETDDLSIYCVPPDLIVSHLRIIDQIYRDLFREPCHPYLGPQPASHDLGPSNWQMVFKSAGLRSCTQRLRTETRVARFTQTAVSPKGLSVKAFRRVSGSAQRPLHFAAGISPDKATTELVCKVVLGYTPARVRGTALSPFVQGADFGALLVTTERVHAVLMGAYLLKLLCRVASYTRFLTTSTRVRRLFDFDTDLFFSYSEYHGHWSCRPESGKSCRAGSLFLGVQWPADAPPTDIIIRSLVQSASLFCLVRRTMKSNAHADGLLQFRPLPFPLNLLFLRKNFPQSPAYPRTRVLFMAAALDMLASIRIHFVLRLASNCRSDFSSFAA